VALTTAMVAGACSLANANAVRSYWLHYLFGLKASQPTLYHAAQQWLGPLPAEQAVSPTRCSLCFAASLSASDLRRAVPRRHLLQDVFVALVTLADSHVRGLRRRPRIPVTV